MARAYEARYRVLIAEALGKIRMFDTDSAE
jgi:hypothetical protein